MLNGPPFLFDVRTDYVKLTNDTVMVPLTLQIRNGDITYSSKDGDSTGTVNILGRVSNINHRVIQTFEDTVKVETPTDLLERTQEQPLGLLEGAAAASGALQGGDRDQGREQPGPRGRVAAQRGRSEVR